MLSLQLLNFEKRSSFGFEKMQVLLKLGVVYANDNNKLSHGRRQPKAGQLTPIRCVILFGLSLFETLVIDFLRAASLLNHFFERNKAD